MEGPFTWRDGKLIPLTDDLRREDVERVQRATREAGIQRPSPTPGLKRFERRWINRKLGWWMDPFDSHQQWYLEHIREIVLGIAGFMFVFWAAMSLRGCG